MMTVTFRNDGTVTVRMAGHEREGNWSVDFDGRLSSNITGRQEVAGRVGLGRSAHDRPGWTRIQIQEARPLTVRSMLACCHMSKMVQVRNVPDALHRKLKVRAVDSGQTLSDYLLAELERLAARPTRHEMLTRIHSRKRVTLKTSAATVSGRSANQRDRGRRIGATGVPPADSARQTGRGAPLSRPGRVPFAPSDRRRGDAGPPSPRSSGRSVN